MAIKRGIGVYHWRLYGKSATYARHVSFLARWVKEKNTLQIGAQDGLIVGKLGIKGVDNNAYAVKLAKSNGVIVDYSNSSRLPYKNEQFDSALITDSLQSYRNLSLALSETRRVIKNYLYISAMSSAPDTIKQTGYFAWKQPKQLIAALRWRGFKLVGDPIYKSDRRRYYFKFQKA